MGDVPGLWADSESGDPQRVVQYLHGGGYVAGSAASHRRLGGHLARAIGCRVFLVDYSRAPEVPHPGPLNDSMAVYRAVLAAGVGPDRFAVAGDSAGGGLALATLLRARDEGLPQPVAGFALSPWTDLEVLGASVDTNTGADRLITVGTLRSLAATFLADGDPRDPWAAPVHGDYRGLCSLYLQVGGAEILVDDSIRVAESARQSGIDVTVDVVPGMQHVFQLRAGRLAEADEAIGRISAWLRPLMGLDTGID
ncbi:alpha/beta hydrolase [Nocardioides sp. LS1]|uniref:alpha/beta hydrolase n=1 Tax=Nocardioides sp. LS1 TaxID=1027620 RepID=UPI0021AB6E30|nr:alpha/beta hydrolase [Nocardioides sp. LS1]